MTLMFLLSTQARSIASQALTESDLEVLVHAYLELFKFFGRASNRARTQNTLMLVESDRRTGSSNASCPKPLG